MPDPIAIAIDGPSASGKGTVAKGVARALRYQYVDTGAMYRAVAYVARQRGVSWDDEARLAPLAAGLRFSFSFDGELLRMNVDGEDLTTAIRTDEIGRGASDVSKLQGVRDALLGLQQAMGAAGGVVMDGRDIGTVVLPDARLKVYLDADVEERAQRRYAEMVQRGVNTTLQETRTGLVARDKQDMERAHAPLRQADDAVRVDTTGMSIPDAIDRVLALARARGA